MRAVMLRPLPIAVFSCVLSLRSQGTWLFLLSLMGTALAQDEALAEESCKAGSESSRCAASNAAAQGSLKWRGFPYYVSHPKFARTIYGGDYIAATFRDYGFEGSVDDDNWDVLWTHRQQYISGGLSDVALPLRPGLRLVNHCNYFGGAGNKCQLAQHVRSIKEHLQKGTAQSHHARHLRSFDLSNEQEFQTWQSLVNEEPSRNWILKPCLGGASKGIEVLHGKDLLNAYSSGGFPPETVAQEYVEHFMNFGGSKFHLRLYVLVTHWAPTTVYLYNGGLVFRSRHTYQQDAARSAARDAFSSISDSVEVLPLSELWEHLDSLARASPGEALALTASVVRTRVHEVLTETLGTRVVESFGDYEALENERGFSCFDLFGVDVILDEELRPFVMEINLGPDLWVSHRGGANVGKQEAVKAPLIQQVVHWASLRVRGGAPSEAPAGSVLKSAREVERAALLNFTRLL
mmetsp:Transcript_2432/g.2566  ORF Transcript_2432/g.2566 Transcript_2432/m.2566 type:complete len:463 (-) Transcript_2432:267-1655(-)